MVLTGYALKITGWTATLLFMGPGGRKLPAAGNVTKKYDFREKFT